MKIALPLDRKELLALGELIQKGYDEMPDDLVTPEMRIAMSVWHSMSYSLTGDRRKFFRFRKPDQTPLDDWFDRNQRTL